MMAEATWMPIANTTNQLSYTITGPATFRAVSQMSTCAVSYSTNGRIKITNLWEGKVSSDWNNFANWSSGAAPNINSCSNTVTIPKGVPNDPLLTTNIPVNNLNILSNGHVTVGNTGKLQVAGVVTANTSGITGCNTRRD